MNENAHPPPREKLSLGCLFAALPPLLLSSGVGFIGAISGIGIYRRLPGHALLAVMLCIPLPLILWLLARVIQRKKPLVLGLDDVGAVGWFLVGMALFTFELPNAVEIAFHTHQKISIDRMKMLGTALEARLAKDGCYPLSLHGLPRELPRLDGWERPFRYLPENSQAGGRCASGYYLGSGGEDGRFSCENLAAYPKGDSGRYDADLVLHDGEFTRIPRGKQLSGDEPVACGPRPSPNPPPSQPAK